jgi:aminoglycoside phosphotransferase (APT) family kinase protein
MGTLIDSSACLEVWEAALAARDEGPRAWVHGDVTGSDLLVRDGHLAGVLDFGCSAVGDAHQ